MSTIVNKKKREIAIKQEEIAILEQEILKLTLEEKQNKRSTPSLQERFPSNSTVRLIGHNEKLRLRRKKATVVGYTDCFIRLERKGEVFLRAPENIDLLEDDE